MNDLDAKQIIGGLIAAKIALHKKRSDYFWWACSEHPTDVGAARLMWQSSQETGYANDLEEAWKSIGMALWPEKEREKV
jgi:hypothetical protein